MCAGVCWRAEEDIDALELELEVVVRSLTQLKLNSGPVEEQ